MEKHKSLVFILCHLVQTKYANAHTLVLDKLDNLELVKNLNASALRFLFKALCHHFRCQRANTCSASAWVVVGFVANILAKAVNREGNAELAKL